MKNTDITSVRLPQELDMKLETYSDLWNTTKSDVVKEALQSYFTHIEAESDSWETGEPYFGRYGSGDGTLSAAYKKRVKEKLHDKYTR
jgi:predicted DNA-binding protein